MESQRLSFPYGDTGQVCVHVVDSDGESIDLADFADITFTMLRSVQDDPSAAVFQGTLTGNDIKILSPSKDGVCQVTIPKAKAVAMMIARPYYWTCRLTSGTGEQSTPVFGTIYADSPINR